MGILKYFLLIITSLSYAQSELQLKPFPTTEQLRDYYIGIPENLKSEDNTLVVSLHGVGSDGTNAYKNYNWGKFSTDYGFIYLAPNGFEKAWSNGLVSPFLEKDKDDISFIKELIPYIIKKYSINPENVFLVGYSGGAMMAYRFVAEVSGLVKKVAIVSGSLEIDPVQIGQGLPLVQIHGRRDLLVTAVNENGGFVGKTSARASAAKWGRINNCKFEDYRDDQLTGEKAYKYLRADCIPVDQNSHYMEYLEFKRYWHLAPFPLRRTVTDYIWKFFQSVH